MAEQAGEQPVRSERTGDVAVVYASDYLTKLSGERVERECRRRLEEGCRALVVDFSQTGLVNSIAVSILLGVIDAANRAKAPLVFANVKDQAKQIFELLGLTRHVKLARDQQDALDMIADSNAVGFATNTKAASD
ncbi:MAG: STAS domain-containing protein [Acidobacteria bacterium]|nr:STAS domain-containing protein [Acidobacteriota bacterium]